MKIVKLSFPPQNWDLKKYSPNNDGIFGDYKFILNDESLVECDYWIVALNLNNNTERAFVNPLNILFDTSESADIIHYSELFLSQFPHVSSFRNDLPHNMLINSIPVIPWFIKKNYSENKGENNFIKSKKISLLASNKTISKNHVNRFLFVKKIKDYFKDKIDIYGAGFTPFITDKIPTLFPYQYSITLETITDKNYFSEKLGDCYLSETFPIYYGCSNLEEYFSEDAFRMIDINNFEEAKLVISEIVESDDSHYNNSLGALKKAKMDYLEKYSLLPVLCSILDKLPKVDTSERKMIKLKKYQPDKDYAFYKRKVLNRLYSLYYK